MSVTLQDIIDSVNRKMQNFVNHATSEAPGDGVTSEFHIPDKYLVADSLSCMVILRDPATGIETAYPVSIPIQMTVDYETSWVKFVDDTADWATANGAPLAAATILWSYGFRHYSDDDLMDAINAGMRELYPSFYTIDKDVSLTTLQGQLDYDLAEGVDANLVTKVELQLGTVWHKWNSWQSDGGDTVDVIRFTRFPPGAPMRITYAKRPATFPGVDPTLEFLTAHVLDTDLETPPVSPICSFSARLPERALEGVVRWAIHDLTDLARTKRVRGDVAVNAQGENINTYRDLQSAAQYTRFRFDSWLSRNPMPQLIGRRA